MYSIYVIYNDKNKKYYIGQTSNLEDRIRLHNDKKFKKSYTSRFDGTWRLIYKEEFITRKESLQREKQLKSFQGRKFLKSKFPILI